MSATCEDFSISQLSLHSAGSQNEDWDRSINLSDSEIATLSATGSSTTPRNSVIFPAEEAEATPGRSTKGPAMQKRSLSELLRLHAEKGTDVKFSAEEASRVAEVLNNWINAGSSPYEGEDDFFARSHDDLSVPAKRSPAFETSGRPRGQSESASNSRPPSSAGLVKS